MSDDDVKTQTTSDDDAKNVGTKYSNSLYKIDDAKDDINASDLNSQSANLTKGLGDDAFSDTDDSSLVAENDRDETETGMTEVDGDDINPLQEKLGDVVVDDGQE